MNDSRSQFGRSLAVAALIGASCAPVVAGAAEPTTEIAELRSMLEEAAKQIAAQRRALTEQENALAIQKRELEEQKRILETLQARMRQPAMQLAGLAADSGRGGPPRGEADKSFTVAANAPQTEGPVGRPPEAETTKPAQVGALTETRGVLTPRGSWTLEPSLTYAHSSNNRVSILGFTILPAITIGVIDIRKVNRDSFIGSLAGRYGITNRLEFEAKMPYTWSMDTTESRPFGTGDNANTITDTRGKGIGDLEFALRYQLNEGGNERPYYIGNLRVKSRTGKGPLEISTDPDTGFQTELPTGSGFWGIQPSLTAIYPSDPAVFFGNVSYLWNVKRNIGNYGQVDPGDAFGFNFGMGLALNEKTSFSVGYDHSIVGRTKIASAGPKVTTPPRTHVGSLLFGYSYRLNDKSSINLSLGAGLTESAPDVQLSVRYPMSF